MKFTLILLWCCFGLAGNAAPLALDLGQGLAYHRVATLPADLPTEESARKQPCVLDLRYAQGDASTGMVLLGWLKFHASPHTPVFLLVNTESSAALLASIASGLPVSGVLVIGAASPALPPDIVLKIAPAEERRAYDALATGIPVESLLNDTPEKPRNDEARLAQEHHGQPGAGSSPDDDAIDVIPAAGSEKSGKARPPAPLIDAALQRAVQLHRSLKALKKI